MRRAVSPPELKYQRMWNYYAAVFETNLLEGEATEAKAVVHPVKLQVLRGEYTIQTRSHGRAILPLRGIVGEEHSIPPLPQIHTDPKKTYIIVSSATKAPQHLAERGCADDVDRAITLAGLFMDPFLFARPLYRGWLGDHPRQFTHAEVLFTPWQQFDARLIERNMKVARSVLLRDASRSRQFSLMTRLFNRAITLTEPEETFLWLWTCLEVFPMTDTSDIRPISEFLASYVGQPQKTISDTLQVGRLCGRRSALVHDGAIGLSGRELNETVHKLLQIVKCVLRGMVNIPYAGELDRWLRPSAG